MARAILLLIPITLLAQEPKSVRKEMESVLYLLGAAVGAKDGHKERKKAAIHLRRLLPKISALPIKEQRFLFMAAMDVIPSNTELLRRFAEEIYKQEGAQVLPFFEARADEDGQRLAFLAPVIGKILEERPSDIHRILNKWLNRPKLETHTLHLIQGPKAFNRLIYYIRRKALRRTKAGYIGAPPEIFILGAIVRARPEMLSAFHLRTLYEIIESPNSEGHGMALARVLGRSYDRSSDERKSELMKKSHEWLKGDSGRMRTMGATLLVEAGLNGLTHQFAIVAAIDDRVSSSNRDKLAELYLEASRNDTTATSLGNIIAKWPLLTPALRAKVFLRSEEWLARSPPQSEREWVYEAYRQASVRKNSYAGLCEAVCGLYTRVINLNPALTVERTRVPVAQRFPWLGLKYLFLERARPYCQSHTKREFETPIVRLKEMWKEGAFKTVLTEPLDGSIYAPTDAVFAPAIGSLLLQTTGHKDPEWQTELALAQDFLLKHPRQIQRAGPGSGMTTYALAFTALASEKPDLRNLLDRQGKFYAHNMPYAPGGRFRDVRASMGRSPIYQVVRMLHDPRAESYALEALKMTGREAPIMAAVGQTQPTGSAHIGPQGIGAHYPFPSAPYEAALLQLLERRGHNMKDQRKEMTENLLSRIGPDGLFEVGAPGYRFHSQSLGGLALLSLIDQNGCYGHKKRSPGILTELALAQAAAHHSKPKRKVGTLIRAIPFDPFKTMRVEFNPPACVAD